MEYKMLFILFAASFFILNFLAKLKIGSYKNPLFFYLFVWIICILISMINPYELYTISAETYLLLFLSIIFFFFGFIIIVKPKSQIYNMKLNIDLTNSISKIIFFVQMIIISILIMYFIKYNKLISSLGAEYARTIKFTQGYLFNSYLEIVTYNWILSALIYLFGMFFIAKYILTKRIEKNLILGVANILIYSTVGNGRMILFDFLCYFILIIIYTEPKSKNIFNILKKIKVGYIVVGCIFIYVMTLLYANRIGASLSVNNFFKLLSENINQSIIYFTGPFVSLDIFLNNKMYDAYIYTFGKCTFSGISELIGNIFINSGINYISGESIIGNITTTPIYIGENQTFNAFYTSLLNFYLDGGIIGIIIFSSLFGLFVACIFNRYEKNHNIFNLLILVYVTWIMIASSYRLPSSFNIFIVIFSLLLMEKLLKSKKFKK